MIKMIKGVNKNVVVIKNLKNDIFEEVIFILKPERKKPIEKYRLLFQQIEA